MLAHLEGALTARSPNNGMGLPDAQEAPMTDRDMLIELLAMALHANPDEWYRDSEARRCYRAEVARAVTPEDLYGKDEEYRDLDRAAAH